MVTKQTARIALGLIGGCLLMATASAQKIKVESHRDEKADFKALRTYTWLPSPPAVRNAAPDAATNPSLTQEVLGPHIVNAVDRELTARGLKRVEQGESDVNVVYFAALTVGVNISELGSYYQYTTGWALPYLTGPATTSDIVERGTIIIDMVARRSKTAIWRGQVSTNVNQENTLEKRIARINEAITRVFERYPVKPVRTR
jgi:Domain of unknown function (DUF4136)